MYTAIYKKSGKYYSAWVLEVPGANTQGRTKKEAEKNLKEALSLVLSARNKYLRKELGKSKVTRKALALV
jgi:predicted RNase H-like HicB family nuclease